MLVDLRTIAMIHTETVIKNVILALKYFCAVRYTISFSRTSIKVLKGLSHSATRIGVSRLLALRELISHRAVSSYSLEHGSVTFVDFRDVRNPKW